MAGEQKARASTGLMLGVFALSALVGGAAAGLMLAFMQSGAPERSTASTEGVGIITPVVRGRGMAVSGPSGKAVAGSAVLAKNANESVMARAPAPATAPAPAVARRPAADAPSANKAAAGKPAAIAADSTGGAELARLTNQVVAALSAMNGGGATQDETAPDTAAAGAERLRQTLAELVSTAQAQGKSDEEIRKLVAEALDSAGDENIPAILRDASGKVNVRRLLASVMPARRRDVMPRDAAGLAYFRQLEAEAGSTYTDDRPPASGRAGLKSIGGARKASGRFFVRNGKRYTIIRKGDTLSDIAYAAYGDVLAYPAILRANRGRISVRKLKPGMRILIPDIGRKSRLRQKARRKSAVGGAAPGVPRKVRKPASTRQPAGDRVITLPASGAPADAAGGQKPVKVTNFHSTHEAKPLPITPQRTSR